MNNLMKAKHQKLLGVLPLTLICGAIQMTMLSEAFAAPIVAPKSQAVSTSHVDTYFSALAVKDKQGVAPHFAPNIVLHGPIFAQPTQGKEAVVQILSGFLDTIDSLEVNKTFASGQDVAVFFSFSVNGITVNGNEHLHVNEKGLIDSIEVAWRPLPASVAVQEIMAKKLGFAPMHLVQESAASSVRE